MVLRESPAALRTQKTHSCTNGSDGYRAARVARSVLAGGWAVSVAAQVYGVSTH